MMMTEPFKEALNDCLGENKVFDDVSTLTQFSKDYSWFSPILEKELADCRADYVAKPETQDELIATVRLACQHQIPITPRGKGTGNYGQGVPLKGGLILDTSRLKKVIEIGDGFIHAEAGANFIQLESAARETEQELAMFPSTFNSCLGGFIAGGAGGTGSVEHGFIFNRYVKALKVLPCKVDAEPFWVEGEETVPYVHAYGTTGVILEAKVKLVPAREWTALFSHFEPSEWKQACAAAFKLIQMPVMPRLVSFEEPSFIPCFPPHDCLSDAKINLRAMVCVSEIEAASKCIETEGGTVVGHHSDSKTLDLLSLLSYNHPTLWVKKKYPDFCHVQIGGQPIWETPEAVKACLPDSMLHCEARWMHGKPTLGGVFLSRFVDEDTLFSGFKQLRALGCFVMNVHTFKLGTDHLPTVEDLHRFSSENDPNGLLNPGKIPR